MSNTPGVGQSGDYFGWGAAFPNSVAVVFATLSDPTDSAVPYTAIALNGDPTVLLVNSKNTRVFSNGGTWYCWVDYNGGSQSLEIRLSSTSTRPTLSLIETNINLYNTLLQPEMYLGFGAGSSSSYSLPTILSWSFSVNQIDDSEFPPLFLFFLFFLVRFSSITFPALIPTLFFSFFIFHFSPFRCSISFEQ